MSHCPFFLSFLLSSIHIPSALFPSLVSLSVVSFCLSSLSFFSQYFTTQSAKDELDYVPWLPVSVIRPPGTGKADQNRTKSEADEEANLNALLGTLGPFKKDKTSISLGEAVGGTVGVVRLDDSLERDSERSMPDVVSTIQLQRVAPRCHCQVIYVTYGDQVEAEISRASSPGNSSVSCIISNLLIFDHLCSCLRCVASCLHIKW